MAQGCLLDTSFLITLASLERTQHRVAREYFRYALDSGIPLYLPTLVAMAFSRKQSIEQLGLHQVIVLPLNLPEAVLAAKLAEASPRNEGDDALRGTRSSRSTILMPSRTDARAWSTTKNAP